MMKCNIPNLLMAFDFIIDLITPIFPFNSFKPVFFPHLELSPCKSIRKVLFIYFIINKHIDSFWYSSNYKHIDSF